MGQKIEQKTIIVRCSPDSHVWMDYIKALKDKRGTYIGASLDMMLVHAANCDVLNIQDGINAKNGQAEKYGYKMPKHYPLLENEIYDIKRWTKRWLPSEEDATASWYNLYFKDEDEEDPRGGNVMILKTDGGFTCFFWYYKMPAKEITRSTKFSSESLGDILDILDSVLYDYDLARR